MLTEDCWSASKRNDNHGSGAKVDYKNNNRVKLKVERKVFGRAGLRRQHLMISFKVNAS